MSELPASSEEERRRQLLHQYVVKVKDHREAEARVKKGGLKES